MGLESPKHLEHMKQSNRASYSLEFERSLELGNHHKTKPMAKTFATQLPMRKKKLNRALSINYLKLISIFRESIYVKPYLATRFHRRCLISPQSSAALQETLPRGQPFLLAVLLADFTGYSNPTTGS
jgi:hypothetical protein